jgi:hypothetical protein
MSVVRLVASDEQRRRPGEGRGGYSAELSVALGRLWESGLPSTVKAATMQLAQASQHGLGIVSLPASAWTSHAMMDHVVGRAFGDVDRGVALLYNGSRPALSATEGSPAEGPRQRADISAGLRLGASEG